MNERIVSKVEHRCVHDFSLSSRPTLCDVKVFGIINLFQVTVAVGVVS